MRGVSQEHVWNLAHGRRRAAFQKTVRSKNSFRISPAPQTEEKLMKIKRYQLQAAALSLLVFTICGPATQRLYAQQAAPDNTRTNRNDQAPTADQQKMNASDREMTQKIRKAIQQDKTLSTSGHNVKIVTQNGRVTLRGPVRSDDEKAHIRQRAVEIAGADHVDDQLEIAEKK
jgi:hypothetical protein